MELSDMERRWAGVLLPLAGGLLVVAVAQLPVPAIAIVVTVGTLIGLVAVLPERPWPTVAIAEAPGLALALATAVRDSFGLVGLVVAMSPVVLAISVVLARMGAALRREHDEHRTRYAGKTVDGPTGDPGLFATKARRGAFLIGLLTVLATCNAALTQR